MHGTYHVMGSPMWQSITGESHAHLFEPRIFWVTIRDFGVRMVTRAAVTTKPAASASVRDSVWKKPRSGSRGAGGSHVDVWPEPDDMATTSAISEKNSAAHETMRDSCSFGMSWILGRGWSTNQREARGCGSGVA